MAAERRSACGGITGRRAVFGRSLLMGILAGAGAACVGLGGILIFAHNGIPCRARPRGHRLPPCSSDRTGGVGDPETGRLLAWREGAAAWRVLSVAHASPVSQTWQLQGELDVFS
jgi:hypothetical protein